MAMTEDKIRILVVSHTHWDRAWYWPTERFRIKLIECVRAVIRELKADPEYRFTFDGQVLPLVDYLEVCPDDAAYLREAARAGRIAIGPMYCLSDVYCTGGEALIRNLLLGQKWCNRFGGGYQSVLHMPDTFGITPSMPMIAEGFGMKAFTFMRGLAGQVPGLTDMVTVQGIEPQFPKGTRHFRWQSPDGSEIRTIILRDGYANAAYRSAVDPVTDKLNIEKYAAALQEAAQKQHDGAGAPHLLLAGVDHQIPRSGQGDAMKLASQMNGYDFTYALLEDAADALQAADATQWPVFQGEFHGNGAASVLGGTLSTRIYLKQRNAAIEQLLVNQVEPGAVALRLLGQESGLEAAIEHAWKSLLVTHPHDDICGCSVDSVHRTNEHAMQQAWETTDAVRRRLVIGLFKHYGANVQADVRPSFALMNLQGSERLGPSRVQFDYEGQRSWGDIKCSGAYAVINEQGDPVPFREISRGQSTEHPRLTTELEIYAPLAPATFTRFCIQPLDSWPEGKSATQMMAENEFLRVTLHPNGTFDLEEKATGQQYQGLGLFSGQADVGDSYDFSDIPGQPEEVFDQLAFKIERKDWPGGLVELKACGELPIPASTDSTTRERSKEVVALPVEVRLVLAPGARQVEVYIRFTNQASDHRLRWNLTLHQKVESSLAGLKFAVMERPAGSAPEGDVAPRIWPEHPCDDFVAAGPLCLFSSFPGNYEIVGEDTSRLAFTILRSVSWLTNPNKLATRPGDDSGPYTFVPEARCLGRTFDLHFAVRPFAPAEKDQLLREAMLWRANPLAGQTDATVPYPVRLEQPQPESLYSVNEPLLITACKPATEGDGSVLRIFNPTGMSQVAKVKVPDPHAWVAVRLNETPDVAGQITYGEKDLSFEVAPFGLRTIKAR